MTVVYEFHAAVDQAHPKIPTVVTVDDVNRRHRLMKEEWDEIEEELQRLRAALRRGARLPEVLEVYRRLLKELADLRYTVEGTAVELGLPIDAAFATVHESNMTKAFDDGFRKDRLGKVLHGPNYMPPDMSLLVPDPIDVESYKDGDTLVTPAFTFTAGSGVTLG